MVRPSSRFSKTAATGRRVPRNTHAPLIFPGTLSTASHFDQSSDISASSRAILTQPFPRFLSSLSLSLRPLRLSVSAREGRGTWPKGQVIGRDSTFNENGAEGIGDFIIQRYERFRFYRTSKRILSPKEARSHGY